MKTLGLLGGVASGKSLVSKQLAEMGAVLLDADRAGHEALRLPEIEAVARQRWGDAILGNDGHIDRSRLAKNRIRRAARRTSASGNTWKP